jgi:hypothetical protein
MEDSLSREISLRSGRADGGSSGNSNSNKIRPNTTGELDTSTFVKLPSRVSRTVKAVVLPSTASIAHSTSDTKEETTIPSFRPKAPRIRRADANSDNVCDEKSLGIAGTKMGDGDSYNTLLLDNPKATLAVGTSSIPKGRKKKSAAKSSNISDLWQELHKFSMSSSSRSLTEQADEIHYVNVQKGAPQESKTQQLVTPTDQQPAMLFDRRSNPNCPDLFEIPELPSGTLLSINILSTWGDPHYVGLMGVEIFDDCGRLVTLTNPDAQLWADPADINVLAEYGNDPRTVDNLIDGVNHTCDDLHSWLAPYTLGRNHFVNFKFDEVTTISMIRFWNYNKSRIHSARGARYIEISLQNDSVPGSNQRKVVFKGEIRRAVGSHSLSDYEQCCECILFTNKSRILALIEKYDPFNRIIHQQSITEEGVGGAGDRETQEVRRRLFQYPDFGVNEFAANPSNAGSGQAVAGSSNGNNLTNALYRPGHDSGVNQRAAGAMTGRNIAVDKNPRPATGKARSMGSNGSEQRDGPVGGHTPTRTFAEQLEDNSQIPISGFNPAQNRDASATLSQILNDNMGGSSSSGALLRPSTAALARTQKAVTGRYIEVQILSNWGDTEYVGITKLAGVDKELSEFPLSTPVVKYCRIDDSVKATRSNASYDKPPADSCADCELLVAGSGQTTDPNTMWLALLPPNSQSNPSSPASSHCVITLHFDLKRRKEFKGLRIYNYNSSSTFDGRRNSEETCKGVKNVRVLVDSVLHFNSVVRKAPGASNFDYAQFLPLISAAAGGGTSSHSFRKALNLGASLDFGLLPTFGEGAADSNVSGSSSGRSSSVKDVGRSGNSSGLSTGPMGVDLRSLSYSPEPLTETTPRDSAGFFSSNPSNAANSAVKDARAVTWGRSTASGLDVGGVDTDSGDRWNVNRIERPSGPVIMQQRWESSDDVRKGADKVTEQRNTAPYDEDDDDIFAQSIGGISVSLLGVPVVQQYETPVSTEFVFVVYCSAGDRDLL